MPKQFYDYVPLGTIEIHITTKGYPYVEHCVVDIESFAMGRRVFPCGSGNDYTLNISDVAEVNKILKANGIDVWKRTNG
jgi:hypothetical protein